jgi:hypothetical protein
MSSLFKDRKVTEGSSFSKQFISYGIRMLKVNKIEIVESKKTPSRVQHVFYVETPEIGGGFKGFKDEESGYEAKGLIGKVKFGQYFDPDSEDAYDLRQKQSFLDDLFLVAEKAEITDQLAQLDESTPWPKVISTIEKALKDKFLWFLVTGEEYQKGKFILSFGTVPLGKDEDGKYIFRILVKEPKFHKQIIRDDAGTIIEVKGENTIGEHKGVKATLKFDPTYHLKAYEASDADGGLNLGVNDGDLPF